MFLKHCLPVTDKAIFVRVCQFFFFFSGILSALGNLLSQTLEARKKAKHGNPCNEIDAAGAARYAVYGWDFNLCSWFTWNKNKIKKKSGQCCSPVQLKLIFCISDGVKDKHIDLLSTYLNLTFYLEAQCCCVLQALDHRAGEPLFLPANGAVDTQHRPMLHSQTSSPGPPFLCSWLSAPFLLCDEHSRGEPWQIDVIWKREIVELS